MGEKITKRLAGGAFVALVFLFVAEVFLECLYFQRNDGHCALFFYADKASKSISRVQRTTEYSKPIFVDDGALGYAARPGNYEIKLTYKKLLQQRCRTFHATINASGYRPTSQHPDIYNDKPDIWLFGCSYTWGWSVDDSNTWPWLVQGRLPDYKIKNYSGNGYGTIHALLQLRQLLSSNQVPDTVVIVYADFHLVRNVAAPSRLSEFAVMSTEQEYHHPKASLDNGQLKIETIPLKPIVGKDPSIEYQKHEH